MTVIENEFDMFMKNDEPHSPSRTIIFSDIDKKERLSFAAGFSSDQVIFVNQMPPITPDTQRKTEGFFSFNHDSFHYLNPQS